MPVAAKKRMSLKNESKKCAERFWTFFPHFVLCGTLVAYAALGALIFQYIEGGSPSTTEKQYRQFLGEIVYIVQNDTSNSSCTHECVVNDVEAKMKEFNSLWFQRPSRWSFFGSMFFCCTVFTTVGYGEIYPVTLPGKVACVLYAMMGIPLMLLVILDVGDFLALVMSRAYIRIHKVLCSHTWSPWKTREKTLDSDHRALMDGTLVFNHDVVTCEPLDIRQVLHSQASVRHNSIQLENNKAIFEKIVSRDNLLQKGPLLRALSCPELDQQLPPPTEYVKGDCKGIGDEMDTLDVPFILILFVVFAYICFGGLILPLWETEFEGFDSYYFCFITLTAIGFGDIVPKHPKYFMLTSLFIIGGMAIMSMAFKLSQKRIVCCYRKCIKFIGRGKVETFQNEENN
ncbi:potassium channel subfamily K member 18 [Odontesthes bonariensis]|uniref:potassium channel subfamily K member 18 n=1 Tax=Odontesthes bonariensis TaxID=219752 RepID=UPI003F5898BA